jgi:hypothetical protein
MQCPSHIKIPTFTSSSEPEPCDNSTRNIPVISTVHCSQTTKQNAAFVHADVDWTLLACLLLAACVWMVVAHLFTPHCRAAVLARLGRRGVRQHQVWALEVAVYNGHRVAVLHDIVPSIAGDVTVE